MASKHNITTFEKEKNIKNHVPINVPPQKGTEIRPQDKVTINDEIKKTTCKKFIE